MGLALATWFFDMAFNLERGAELCEKWDLIPAHVDVLITHGPPQFVLDRTATGENVSCEELRVAARRTRPRLLWNGGRLDAI